MKDQEIFVSIKCAVYNHEQYIRQCLEGSVMQKTNFRFEAIVHDDASTDGSAAIIREYAEKYPDIIKPIYEIENQYSKRDGSLTRIMNAACKGKYIAVCEGDDYWIDPLKLQKQFDFMEEHSDYMLCGTNGLVLWDHGVNAPEYFHRRFISSELTPENTIGKWPFPTASLFYRKELLNYLDDFKCKIYSGDIRLMLVALANGRIWSFGDVTTIYRRNNDMNSSTNRVKSKNDHGEFYFGQMIQLYSAYNEYTNYKFETQINKIILKDRKLLTILKYRKKIGLFAIFIHPCLFLRRTILMKFTKTLKYIIYKYIILGVILLQITAII